MEMIPVCQGTRFRERIISPEIISVNFMQAHSSVMVKKVEKPAGFFFLQVINIFANSFIATSHYLRCVDVAFNCQILSRQFRAFCFLLSAYSLHLAT